MYIYRIFNQSAKKWWYHRQLRAQGDIAEARKRERHAILDKVKSFRRAIATGGFLTIGRGGTTLHQGRYTEGKLTYMHGQLQSYERHGPLFRAALVLGLPIIDSTTIPDDLISKIIRYPMAQPGNMETANPPYSGWDFAPVRDVAKLYYDLGATIYNLPDVILEDYPVPALRGMEPIAHTPKVLDHKRKVTQPHKIPSYDSQDFNSWLAAADHIVSVETGLSLHDLPDADYYFEFDCGESPVMGAWIALEAADYPYDLRDGLSDRWE